MSTLIRAMSDRVFIRPDKKDSKTPSGIEVIERKGHQQQGQGTVVCRGPKVAADLDINDRVVYHDMTAQEVHVDGERLLAVRVADVLAVVAA